MHEARALAWGLTIAMTCAYAWAATPYVDLEQRLTPEQLHATGLDTLSPQQLQRLNQLLRDGDREAPGTQAAQAPVEGREQHDSRLIGFNDEPISSRLVGSLGEWGPGTVFVLENGQQWKVLKGHYRLNHPVQSPQVRIIPGAAGRWFFKLDDDTPGPRVYRID